VPEKMLALILMGVKVVTGRLEVEYNSWIFLQYMVTILRHVSATIGERSTDAPGYGRGGGRAPRVAGGVCPPPPHPHTRVHRLIEKGER
jgi:hypothetical protein